MLRLFKVNNYSQCDVKTHFYIYRNIKYIILYLSKYKIYEYIKLSIINLNKSTFRYSNKIFYYILRFMRNFRMRFVFFQYSNFII